MHPFIHSFNPAITTPWQSRNDWDIWKTIAKKFSELAAHHLGVRKDVVAQPLQHDSPGAMATPRGRVLDWRSEEHTSELQSRGHLVCRLLLEKKKQRRLERTTDETLTTTTTPTTIHHPAGT